MESTKDLSAKWIQLLWLSDINGTNFKKNIVQSSQESILNWLLNVKLPLQTSTAIFFF